MGVRTTSSEIMRHQLAAIVESSQDAIIGKTLDGIITSWNQAAEDIFGYSAEEMAGKSILTIVPPDRAHEVPDILTRLRKGERILHYPTQRIKKDGTIVDVSLAISPIRNRDGEIVGASTISRDISDFVYHQRALAAYKAQLEAVLNSATEVSIIATDTNGLITTFNPGSEKMLGYTAAEMVGKQTPIAFHLESEIEEHARKLSAEMGRPIEGFEAFVALARQGSHEKREWTYVRKDGTHITVELVVTAVHDSAGNLTGFLGIAIDVTAREIAEHELEAEKERLAFTLQSIGEGVVVTDPQEMIQIMNPSAESITAWPADAATGRHLCDVLAAEDEKGNSLCYVFRPIEDGADSRDAADQMKLSIRNREGMLIPIEVNWSRIRDRSGKTMGMVGVFRDITRQVELERAKEEFIATMAHDLKSPLASIMGFVQLLDDPRYGEISPEKQEFLQWIRRSGDNLHELITNILASSRIEAGHMTYNFTDFSLDELLLELKRTFTPLAAEAGVTLQFTSRPETWVNADRERIRQVFHNLVSNALRYTPAGGTIEISAQTEDRRVSIRVSDTGRGIAQSEQGRLFDKFTQARGETRGTGLGLYIVKNLLAAHGSDITVKSAPGEGTSFFFSLASCAPPMEKAPANQRLFLVGEEPQEARWAALSLEQLGYMPIIAANGMEALRKIKSIRPEIILIHNPLPDTTLRAFIDELRHQPAAAGIPMILLSSTRVPELQNEFGAVAPLPIDAAVVDQVIQSIIKH